jgi:Tfp pilus assembly protein PilN
MLERIEINLLPAEYRFHPHNLILIKREVIYPFLVLVIAFTVMALWVVMIKVEIHDYQGKISSIEAMIKENQYVQSEIRRLESERTIVLEKVKALERINVNRGKWVGLMEAFCRCLPDQTWITSILESAGASNMLEISGRTLSFPEVASFMSRLSASEYITSVDLINIELIKAGAKSFNFMISCGINPDAGLTPTNAGLKTPAVR